MDCGERFEIIGAVILPFYYGFNVLTVPLFFSTIYDSPIVHHPRVISHRVPFGTFNTARNLSLYGSRFQTEVVNGTTLESV